MFQWKYFKIFFIIIQFIVFLINFKKAIFEKVRFDLKLYLCTYEKKENKYIREFIECYKNYGVDKIYLYDNNDIKGERFEDVIGDYIIEKFC